MNSFLWFIIILFCIGLIFFLIIISQTTSSHAPKSEVSPQAIRKMSAAGTFYPSDPAALTIQLDKYLSQAEKINLKNPLRVLIAPHAGLDYSGQTASFAFKQIVGRDIRKVILIGPSHHHVFSHIALLSSGEWETPLGNIPIDSDLANLLLSPAMGIKSDALVHQTEHSLELELLFLKKVLPDIKIVPVLVSQPSEETISALAYKIAAVMDDQTLLVFSTDLSHYPVYETATKVDHQTIQTLISNGQVSSSPPAGVETLACGHQALRLLPKLSALLGLDPPQLLKYQNSGDVTTNKDRVVGYASIAVTGQNSKIIQPVLSDSAQKEALTLAKTTLEAFLTNQKPDINVADPVLNLPLGAFITIRNKGELRGCIGEFDPDKPLFQVIQEKTLAAAASDPRFKPVTLSELPDLSLEISVMSPKIQISDWRNIILGTDGIVVTNNNHSGTFLPQVATETGWQLEELLSHLCTEKAGLPSDCYTDPATRIYTFRTQEF